MRGIALGWAVAALAAFASPAAALASDRTPIETVKGIDLGQAYTMDELAVVADADVRCDADEQARLSKKYWRYRATDKCLIVTTYLGYRVVLAIDRTKLNIVAAIEVRGLPNEAYGQLHAFFLERLGPPIQRKPTAPGDFPLPQPQELWRASPDTKVHLSGWKGTQLRFFLDRDVQELDASDM